MQTDLAVLTDAFDAFLAGSCPPARVRAIEAGEPADALWGEIEAAGWADAFVPEAAGGAGLAFAELRPLVEACGAHALPVPLAQTLAARAELARRGRARLRGPVLLEALGPALSAEDRQAWLAALTTAQIAGAAARVLELTIAYARERVQFGRPIGSFQAVQQQLALMAEQTAAARMAAAIAFDAPDASGAESVLRPDPIRAAMAKCVAGEAAAAVAAGGHAVHGAIGITADCDLQLYTRRLIAWRTEGGSPTHAARRVGADWWTSGATHAIDHVRSRLGH